MIIEADGIGEAYTYLLDELLKSRAIVAPRGLGTKELVGVQVRVANARRNILVSDARKLNYRFMVAEWLWIFFGRDDVKTISRFNPRIKEFSDDGVTFSGAYGPRFRQQELNLIRALKIDTFSRRGVISLWRDNPRCDSKDVPCTLTLQLLLRPERSYVIVNMRSSDAFLGVPYDVFNFTQLASFLLTKLGRGGDRVELILNLASSHLYERDWARARDVLASPVGDLISPSLPFLGPGAGYAYRALREGTAEALPDAIGDPEYKAYGDALLAKTSGGALDVLRTLSESATLKTGVIA